MSKSSTRYTVEGSRYYDAPEDAVREASLMLYVPEDRRISAIEELKQGRPVTLVYGFCSVLITPPQNGK